ncbi:ureidoglycolate hydrolase [Magnaporthiopsis poae ATCC 64411]|uniref:Ureidoglycolate hydrolase n=1 Tax=Magnaporthiopsis poae (strain ATCC 64411 / 73-15) TaxID=644358 RepID=A0A0C4E0F6_MAGP6|nr:ureidoglycolate hydrolase [Magnaporthiopsis poae ATCC 64411]
MHPAAFATAVSQQQHLGIIPHAPIVANQGSAIKYQHPTHPLNFYPHAPSQVPGHAVMNMFSCAARNLQVEATVEADVEVRNIRQTSEVETRDSIVVELSDAENEKGEEEGEEEEEEEENARDAEADEDGASTADRASTEVRDVVEVATGKPVAESSPRRAACGVFPVLILERHPFTTQTFVPMSRDGADTRYLVIVAPSLAPGLPDVNLPVPIPPPNATGGPRLPGRGLPNLKQMRAFVATGSQAVTYAAGTWHAPMVALGAEGSVVDFFVVQYANGVPIEDCQEAVLLSPQTSAPGPAAEGGAPGQQMGVFVQVPLEYLATQRSDNRGTSKL